MNNQIYDASVYNAAPHNVQTAPRYESAAQQVPPRPSMVKETSQVTIVSTDGRVSQMQQIADKEKELYSREMQLRYREEKVAERERVVADFDVKAPNWPACRPLVHHNILEDIPAPHQKIVKRMYASWYFSCMTYLVNFFGAFALVVLKAEAGGSTFGLALLILVAGIPFSFCFWYRPLYKGCRCQRSLEFFFFFFNFSLHLLMSAILCIGIPGWGGAGIMYALSMFGTNLGAAILCAVASSFFILECIMGIWNIKTVYQTYRNLGLSADGARSEAVPTVTSQVVSGSSPGKSSIAAF